jgi:Leucine-rich repeat (LRR) protein
MKNLSNSNLFMVVAISTGCCFDLGLGRLESIHFLEKYPIDGVELMIAFPNELLNFELDKQALSFLKKLEFVSIHMPFKDIIYDNNKETQELMNTSGFELDNNGLYIGDIYDTIHNNLYLAINNINCMSQNYFK